MSLDFFMLYSCMAGQPTFDNVNSPNAILFVNNTDALLSSTLEFLNMSGTVVNNMTSVNGMLVCSANVSIREDLARGRPTIIGSETNGTFVDGSAQCGGDRDCGKLYKINNYLST